MLRYNAFPVYKIQNNISLQLSNFRLHLVREILTESRSKTSIYIGRPSIRSSPLRLTARYFPSLMLQTSQLAEEPRGRCVVCFSYKIRCDSEYMSC